MINEASMTLLTDLSHLDVVGWNVSPKLDGCRAYWDGKQFWTRGGKVIKAPQWFTDAMPSCHLDGEIYAGIGKYEVSRRAVQYGQFTPECTFMVFDVPQASGTWCQRMDSVSICLAACHCFKIPCGMVASIEHLRLLLADVREGGGEGLVLRNPSAEGYETGRTVNAMRVKELDTIDLLLARGMAA